MTSRSHHVTFAIGCTIVVVVTLLFLLHKTHTQMQDIQIRLLHTDSKYRSLTRQFDSLFEYKNRLEKSFISLKTEKASLLEIDDAAREDLSMVKSNCEKQLKSLEEELQTCKNKELFTGPLKETSSGSEKTKLPSHPLLAPLSLARESLQPSPTRSQNPKPTSSSSPGSVPLNRLSMTDLKGPKENEAIQSPIGHVSAHPGQPSGDPNEDTAGNVLI